MERRPLAEPGRHAPVVNVPGGNETRETRVYDAATTGATLSIGESYLLSKSDRAARPGNGEPHPHRVGYGIQKEPAFREGIPERRKWATIED